MKTAILIDGNSLMYRAYFATAVFSTMTNSKGLNTNCIYAFYNMVYKLNLDKYDYVLMAFDAGKKTKRHEILPSYKDGRKETPKELIEQIPYVKELSRAFGAFVLEKELIEADDIVGTAKEILTKEGVEVSIISSDKDLLQLVGKNSKVFLTKKGVSNLEEYNHKNFFELVGLNPEQIPDLKGLMGDSSDNLKGIPGIGEKTALKLISEFGSLENIVSSIDVLKGKQKQKFEEHYQDGLICKEIATIDTNAELDMNLELLEYNGVDNEAMINLMKDLEFNSVIDRYTQNMDKEELNHVIASDDEIIKEILLEDLSFFILEYKDDNYHKSDILGININFKNTQYYFDFEKFKDSKLLAEYLVKAKKATFDLKASYVLLNKYNIRLDNVIFDCLLAAYVIDPDTKDNLASIAGRYSINCPIDSELYNKKFEYDVEKVAIHSAYKLIVIEKLYNLLNEKLDRELFELEMSLAYCLADMEIRGIKVDLEELIANKEKYSELLANLEFEIHFLAGVKFNINSPKQLGEVLFDHLEIPYYKKTKSGTYSTSVDILNKIKDYEIVQKVLLYRKYSKLLSTYVEGIEKSLINDEIHTIYKQALTVTGRLSSVEPNMQNLPIRSDDGRELRKMFVSKNGLLLGLDYSQIELRVLASMSNDEVMVDAFNNDLDIHSITAAKISAVELDEVTPEYRRIAKAVNFGIIYGQTPFGLSEELGISFVESKKFIEDYFKTYPKIKEFLDSLVNFTKENNYAKTIYNRRRYISDINSTNKMAREFAVRTSMNAPIQGSAADILKLAMVKLYKDLNDNNLKSKIILQIHDELILDVFVEEKEIVQDLAIKAMENAYKLLVPLKVDYAFGKNLFELK